jgi:hypothetical protein
MPKKKERDQLAEIRMAQQHLTDLIERFDADNRPPTTTEMETLPMPRKISKDGHHRPRTPKLPIDPEVLAKAERLIQEKPRSHQELIELMGLPANKIRAITNNIGRDPDLFLMNLNDDANSALWYLPSKKALRREMARLRNKLRMIGEDI